MSDNQTSTGNEQLPNELTAPEPTVQEGQVPADNVQDDEIAYKDDDSFSFVDDLENYDKENFNDIEADRQPEDSANNGEANVNAVPQEEGGNTEEMASSEPTTQAPADPAAPPAGTTTSFKNPKKVNGRFVQDCYFYLDTGCTKVYSFIVLVMQ